MTSLKYTGTCPHCPAPSPSNSESNRSMACLSTRPSATGSWLATGQVRAGTHQRRRRCDFESVQPGQTPQQLLLNIFFPRNTPIFSFPTESYFGCKAQIPKTPFQHVFFFFFSNQFFPCCCCWLLRVVCCHLLCGLSPFCSDSSL